MRRVILAVTLVVLCAAVSFGQTAKAGSLAPGNSVLLPSALQNTQLLGSQLPSVAVTAVSLFNYDFFGKHDKKGNCTTDDTTSKLFSSKEKCRGTVPEPSVLWMLALSGIAGVAGLTVVRRMRRT